MVVVGDASRASTGPQFAQFILASGCQCNIRPEIKQINQLAVSSEYINSKFNNRNSRKLSLF